MAELKKRMEIVESMVIFGEIDSTLEAGIQVDKELNEGVTLDVLYSYWVIYKPTCI